MNRADENGATRTHVVTGAASGMGLEVVRRLIDRGDEVVALVRSEARMAQLYDELPGLAAVQVADLADIAELQMVATELAANYGRVDSLLHVAGAVDLFPVSELDLLQWRRQLDVNLTAPVVLTQAFLPALRAAKGTVIFVNSGAGLSASPTWSAYAASKFGLRALADSLRAEEAEHGVRVTTVYPSRTATPMQEKVHQQEGRPYDASRWIQPSTVAEAILHVLDLPDDATISELTLRPS
jgi:NADP-dependent 3-hydroxy acid dehydrogenase YdfG